MKKLVFVLIVIFIVTLTVFATPDFSAVNETLGNDFSYNPEEIIDKILKNQLELDGNNIFEKIIHLFTSSVKKIFPHILSLVTITVVMSIVEKLKFINSKSEAAMLFGGKIIFSAVLITSSLVFIENAKETLEQIKCFTEALLPIIMTLLASIGATGTVSILGPSQALLSGVLINICVNFILPMILIGFMVAMVNETLSDNKLKGFSELMKNFSSWAIGGIFVIFSAIIALQGVASSVSDGISIRSVKYAISTSVPIIGASISENLSVVISSTASIKSAAGIFGIIAIIGVVSMPIINIWAYIIALNLFSALVHPFANDFVYVQIKNATEFLKLAAIVMLGVSMLWFIYLGVLIFAGGNFF